MPHRGLSERRVACDVIKSPNSHRISFDEPDDYHHHDVGDDNHDDYEHDGGGGDDDAKVKLPARLPKTSII